MDMIRTDGGNPDFIDLCGQLDDNLNELVGGAKQRAQYDQYNGLEDIHDVILIYSDGVPAACGSFKRYDEGIAEVKRVFVRREFRGRGFSRMIMEELERMALAAGYGTFYLETGSVLKAARGLYASLGFAVRENYGPYAQMGDSICMEKTLTRSPRG